MDIFSNLISLSKDMDTEAKIEGRMKSARNLEFLAKLIINKMDYPSMMIVKDSNKLAKIDEQRETWLEDNGYESERDTLDERMADNHARLAQWSSALQDVGCDEETVAKLIKSRILWRIESNGNPYHSEVQIKQWMDTGETREEAIATLNLIAKNQGNDWDEFSNEIRQCMEEAFHNEYVEDRPKELVGVCADRSNTMLEKYFKRFPSLKNKGYRLEAEAIQEACLSA